jgi:hypothetical protein
MKREIYCVYDKVMEEAGPLFYANNESHAKRNFLQMIQNSKIDKVLDYRLVYLGSLNVKTLEFDNMISYTVSMEEDINNEE